LVWRNNRGVYLYFWGSHLVGLPYEAHRMRGPERARVFIVTISSSRYEAMRRGGVFSDESGDLAESMLKSMGHEVVGRMLLGDDLLEIRKAIVGLLHRGDVDVIVTTGGTGVSSSDYTVEAVKPLLDREIEGFGEIFRVVSYQRIGSPAMLSRALAGVARDKLIIVLPGSPDGVRVGLELIGPEIPHILYLIRDHRSSGVPH